MSTVTVHIENDYEDGHRSEDDVTVPAPARDLEAWWEDVIWPHTGDGHDPNIGSCYTATIVSADDTSLVGETREWV